MNNACMNLVAALRDHYDDALDCNAIDEQVYNSAMVRISRLTPEELEQKLHCLANDVLTPDE
jgi:hypothetical protein